MPQRMAMRCCRDDSIRDNISTHSVLEMGVRTSYARACGKRYAAEMRTGWCHSPGLSSVWDDFQHLCFSIGQCGVAEMIA